MGVTRGRKPRAALRFARAALRFARGYDVAAPFGANRKSPTDCRNEKPRKRIVKK